MGCDSQRDAREGDFGGHGGEFCGGGCGGLEVYYPSNVMMMIAMKMLMLERRMRLRKCTIYRRVHLMLQCIPDGGFMDNG